MTVPIRFTRLARDDIRSALDWYESVRAGLSGEFVLVLEACLQLIGRHPEIGSAQPWGTRRKLLQRFPYAVHYRLASGFVEVLGVLPQMIEPASVDQRLQQ
jgi:plasmid stabilization system protein ParE